MIEPVFALSDAVSNSIVGGLVTLALAYMNWKIRGIAATGEKTHTLVNSNMGVQLKLNADLSRWKANQTKLPDDDAAATQSETLLAAHNVKQSIVDAGNKTPQNL